MSCGLAHASELGAANEQNLAGNGGRGVALMGNPSATTLAKNDLFGNATDGLFVDTIVGPTTIAQNRASGNGTSGLNVGIATSAGRHQHPVRRDRRRRQQRARQRRRSAVYGAAHVPVSATECSESRNTASAKSTAAGAGAHTARCSVRASRPRLATPASPIPVRAATRFTPVHSACAPPSLQ